MSRKALADCTFTTDTNTKGQFIGRCEQFPDLRASPRRNRLDAIDAVIELVREHLRYLDQEIDAIKGSKAAGRH